MSGCRGKRCEGLSTYSSVGRSERVREGSRRFERDTELGGYEGTREDPWARVSVDVSARLPWLSLAWLGLA